MFQIFHRNSLFQEIESWFVLKAKLVLHMTVIKHLTINIVPFNKNIMFKIMFYHTLLQMGKNVKFMYIQCNTAKGVKDDIVMCVCFLNLKVYTMTKYTKNISFCFVCVCVRVYVINLIFHFLVFIQQGTLWCKYIINILIFCGSVLVLITIF